MSGWTLLAELCPPWHRRCVWQVDFTHSITLSLGSKQLRQRLSGLQPTDWLCEARCKLRYRPRIWHFQTPLALPGRLFLHPSVSCAGWDLTPPTSRGAHLPRCITRSPSQTGSSLGIHCFRSHFADSQDLCPGIIASLLNCKLFKCYPSPLRTPTKCGKHTTTSQIILRKLSFCCMDPPFFTSFQRFILCFMKWASLPHFPCPFSLQCAWLQI